jgi:hypothetical protein
VDSLSRNNSESLPSNRPERTGGARIRPGSSDLDADDDGKAASDPDAARMADLSPAKAPSANAKNTAGMQDETTRTNCDRVVRCCAAIRSLRKHLGKFSTAGNPLSRIGDDDGIPDELPRLARCSPDECKLPRLIKQHEPPHMKVAPQRAEQPHEKAEKSSRYPRGRSAP